MSSYVFICSHLFVTNQSQKNAGGHILAKKLSEEVAEHTKARKLRPRLGKNRAEFLGLLEQIQSVLNEGWPLIVVWETLRDKGYISFSYGTFVRYAKELVSPEILKKSGTIKTESTRQKKKQSKEIYKELTAGNEQINKPVKTLSTTFKIDHTLTKEDLKRI